MSLKYNVIEVFTNEKACYGKHSVVDSIIEYIKNLKLAARCIVMKGCKGCYENGEIANRNIVVSSLNLPVKIEITLPSTESQNVLLALEEIVTEGIVGIRDLNVFSYRSYKNLIPKQLRIKDVMTPSPKQGNRRTSLSHVLEILLSSSFNGLPIVDANDHPIGLITQHDLITKANMPIRLGLLSGSEKEEKDKLIQVYQNLKSEDVMTSPVITVEEDDVLSQAVSLMLTNGVKRLPVVDTTGKLVGMLCRIDVFKTITNEIPTWGHPDENHIQPGRCKIATDIMLRDTVTVAPDASIEEVIHVIDSNQIQRVAVVDPGNNFLGLISDRDLLAAFAEHQTSILDYFTGRLIVGEKNLPQEKSGLQLLQKKASDIMQTNLITITENTSIDEVIKLMAEKGLKRLPVVNSDKKFIGMLSRDSLLRAGIRNHESLKANDSF